MRNVIQYKEGENSWARWIKKRIKNNLNFIGVATGPTGIGKSWFEISMAHSIDPGFEPKQIAFNFEQIMQIVRSDWFKKKEWKIVIFDEAQVAISNRRWQSEVNQLMNWLLSTFRHENIIFLMTSPYIDFLDNQTRKLVHTEFNVMGHSEKKKLTHLRPLILDYNGKLRKFYYHCLYVIKKGKYQKLKDWYVSTPPKHLIIPYEKDKTKFTMKLNAHIAERLTDIGKKGTKKKSNKPLTETQEKILEYWNKGILVQKEIAEKMDTNPPNICENEQRMRNKGYIKPQVRK